MWLVVCTTRWEFLPIYEIHKRRNLLHDKMTFIWSLFLDLFLILVL